jgi:hypothetical protein
VVVKYYTENSLVTFHIDDWSLSVERVKQA